MRNAAGRDFQGRVMGNSGATGAGTGTMRPADYLALSTTPAGTAPIIADGNTSLTGEITTGGLGRALATFAMTAGATSYTLTKQFTATDATPRTVERVAVFNAAAGGTMPFETAVPSPPTLASIGDQVTVTETINIA